MSKKCDICNCKLGLFTKFNIVNGVACSNCIRISKSYQTNTIEELKEFWNINNERFLKFKPTTVLKGLGMAPVSIDIENKLFFVGKQNNKNQNIIYSFDEINSYNLGTIGEKTITQKKGVVSRAVVGDLIAGPIGAAIGANTAKEKTKTIGGINVVNITFTIPSGQYNTTVAYPPTGFTDFLDNCILEKQKILIKKG